MSIEDIKEKPSEGDAVHAVVSFTIDNIDDNNVITTFKSPNGKTVKVTGEVDEAMHIALQADEAELDEKTSRALLRKIDINVLPIICLLYACQFMDKTTNSYAAVMGLKKDLNMVGDMYSWCGSAFYLGYLFFEFPANRILQKFPVAKTTGAFIFIWGAILCFHAIPNEYAGFVALRTLLGVFESAITPAMVIITGQWYRAEEHFFRTSIWFACNGIGTIMGGGIGYGLSVHQDSYSIIPWKILFIVTGLMTIVVGILFTLQIPDLPTKAWFLTEREKILVVKRIRSNQQGFGNKKFKKHQFIEALTDINTWLYFLFAIASNIPNGATTNFGSILLNSDFGYSSADSLLMNMPCGAVEFVGCILFAYSQRFFRHRMAISFAATTIVVIASCMLAFVKHSNSTRLAGYYLMNVGPITMICALSCFASNTAGHTKKITTNAFFLIGYCVGNLVGPQTFISNQAPAYTGGKISFVVCDVISLALIAIIYFNYWYRNNRKDDFLKRTNTEMELIENIEFADLTDLENPNFRYSL
ncbi:Piso0_005566 [Millerozyma farinosa CBS 7064]|uniref:Piso0_005566 protein n=1 Tax=Pichia sorbitophila (strain ATCC MYA-4447 / BCRC 22081 / CBS 7064 / NBRC 10061 / NRRL Y-12695) TaxID=559304 RepID=G8Y2B5_PICSO|nr:Piso0_005566 [Millerozyma farinosa CBS 7064]